MSRNASSATLLQVSSVATLITMGLHPTGHEAIRSAAAGDAFSLTTAVHVLAIAVLPMMLIGALGLSLQLRARRDVAISGFVIFALGIVAVLIAAAASGLVFTSLAQNLAGLEGVEREPVVQQMYYTGIINRSFSRIYVAFMGAAIVLWSAAMLKETAFPRALAWLGIIAGTSAVLGILSGMLSVNIHGFGAVMIVQAIWFGWSSVILRRLPDGCTP